ncbi:MAG: NAD-glutamate dehydrogenase, partial [Leptospiraceae bacterium]|nr:NAD-glutamate dehydrogenase [Leptospiraceae bacterium]
IQIVHHVRRELNRNSVLLVGINCGMLKPDTLIELFRKNQDRLFSSWTMRFRRLVYNKYVGDRRINLALQRYFSGMSPDYEIHQEPDEALFDLDTLESMTDESEYQVRYYHGHGNSRYDYIKIYAPRANRLSDLVPVLSDFGFTIEGDFTFPYRTAEFERFTYAFRVPPRPQVSDAHRRRIADAIEAALNEHTTCESVNQLVVDADLTARELNLLKAFCAFYFQIDKSFSRISLNQRLLAQPDFIRALTVYFHARLGPDASPKQEQAALAQCESSFAAIESVLDETLCRSFLNIVQAIVRTTYYLQRSEIAFKIHSKSIDLIPEPVPLFEIFVYGYELEGVHLRGGLVARGGIRWSDRNDDFRTEVLGLMKAQMVKNTVIVPVGSKGGFVLKNRTFADRA